MLNPATGRSNGADPGQGQVDPDELIAPLTGRGIWPVLGISAVFHVVLVLVTSIGFIRLCALHGTLDPRTKMKELQQQENEREREEAREATREKLRSEHRGAAQDPEGAGDGDEPLSAIEREITDVSDERPDESSTNLDDLLDDLE